MGDKDNWRATPFPSVQVLLLSCEHLSFLFLSPVNQKVVLCLTLPSPALHLWRENEFEEAGWMGAWRKRSVAQEGSVFFFMWLCWGKWPTYFCSGLSKSSAMLPKECHLKKGSGSCGLFNQLLTTCGSILDENRIAFSSNSSPEFYLPQYSDSVIHPAPRTKGFTWYKDILFSINKCGTTPFSDWIKN